MGTDTVYNTVERKATPIQSATDRLVSFIRNGGWGRYRFFATFYEDDRLFFIP
jgi:hypothetical protein